MKRRGRIFKRRSRLTKQDLSTWSVRYMVDGRQRTETTHETEYEKAEQFLTARLAALDAGTYVTADRERLTVADILGQVEADYDLKGHRSLKTVKSHVGHLTKALGADRRALDVTTGQLQRVLQSWRTAGFSPATCNRRLAILRRAYRLAKLRLDPARIDFGDLFLTEEGSRGTYMAPDVFATIHAALPTSDLQAFFEFSYLCGVRKQQLARTTVGHVNTSTWTITWPKTEVKAKRDHVLALDGRALEIVQELLARRPLHCRHLFHGRHCEPGHTPSKRYACIGDAKKSWRTAVERAGFSVGRKHNGFIWHNTRHSAVTNLVNAGVPKHEAKSISGHASDEVFDRYSIGTEKQQRAALRAVTAYEQELRSTRTTNPVTSLTTRRSA